MIQSLKAYIYIVLILLITIVLTIGQTTIHPLRIYFFWLLWIGLVPIFNHTISRKYINWNFIGSIIGIFTLYTLYTFNLFWEPRNVLWWMLLIIIWILLCSISESNSHYGKGISYSYILGNWLFFWLLLNLSIFSSNEDLGWLSILIWPIILISMVFIISRIVLYFYKK